MLSKGLKTQRSEETPLAFSAAFTSKCVIQKGGWGSDSQSVPDFYQSSCPPHRRVGSDAFEVVRPQPFVGGSASHLAVPARPSGAQQETPSCPLVFRKEGPAFSPDSAPSAWNCKAGRKLGGVGGVGGHRSVCI